MEVMTSACLIFEIGAIARRRALLKNRLPADTLPVIRPLEGKLQANC